MASDTCSKPAFPLGSRVMHPAHGVGTVGGTETVSVGGQSIEVLVVGFDDTRMELRVPLARAPRSGLRPLSTSADFVEALKVVGGRAKTGRAMWSKRAQDFEAKINSGDPLLVAEVIRDTGRNYNASGQSYSERQILERAVARLACEMAAVEETTRAEASDRILASVTRVTAPAATVTSGDMAEAA